MPVAAFVQNPCRFLGETCWFSISALLRERRLLGVFGSNLPAIRGTAQMIHPVVYTCIHHNMESNIKANVESPLVHCGGKTMSPGATGKDSTTPGLPWALDPLLRKSGQQTFVPGTGPWTLVSKIIIPTSALETHPLACRSNLALTHPSLVQWRRSGHQPQRLPEHPLPGISPRTNSPIRSAESGTANEEGSIILHGKHLTRITLVAIPCTRSQNQSIG